MAETARRKTGGAAARSRLDKLVAQVATHLKELDIDRLTPIEALTLLASLKKDVDG